jgi:hypothetical protein
MIELWRRKVWTDKKCVNAIKTACFSKDARIMTQALRFFLGVEQIEKDTDEDVTTKLHIGSLPYVNLFQRDVDVWYQR